jgi:hypothetical protein
MLRENIKKELLDAAEAIEIDIESLDSCRWVNNIYGVEPQYAVGGYDWDEDEEWNAKLVKLAHWVEADGLGEYVRLADDEDLDGDMTMKAVVWLLNMAGEQ